MKILSVLALLAVATQALVINLDVLANDGDDPVCKNSILHE